MLIDTPMTGLIFQQWLAEHLIPEMPPGSIVVCDNLPAYKVPAIRQCLMLEWDCSTSRHTAPTSIRSSRSSQRSKHSCAAPRPGRSTPRSFDAICDALKAIRERFKPAECPNYLRHNKYVQA